jgi:hypothetical protein
MWERLEIFYDSYLNHRYPVIRKENIHGTTSRSPEDLNFKIPR